MYVLLSRTYIVVSQSQLDTVSSLLLECVSLAKWLVSMNGRQLNKAYIL